MASDLWLESADGTVLNLYSSPVMVEEGWVPASPSGGHEKSHDPLWDTIPLTIRGTPANIKDAVRKLRDFEREAVEYNKDMLDNNPVTLCIKQDTEENHTVIIDADLQPVSHPGTSTWLDEGGVGNIQIVRYNFRIKRMPYWESSIAYTDYSANISSWGGTGLMSNPWGTRHARIDHGYINGIALGRAWLGIRKERRGLENFDPLIEIEDGTALSGADSSFVTRAGGSGGAPNCMQTTYVITDALVERGRIIISDFATSGYYDHYIGRYLVLGRVNSNVASAKFGVQLRHGWHNTDSFAANPEVVYTQSSNTTHWRVVSLGSISLPPTPVPHYGSAVPDDIDYYSLRVWSERLTGSGNLYFDGFVLIPTDHLLVISRGITISPASKYWFYSRWDGNRQIMVGETTVDKPDLVSQAAFENWKMPMDDSMFVFVREVGGSAPYSPLITTDDVYFRWVPRWHHYRIARP